MSGVPVLWIVYNSDAEVAESVFMKKDAAIARSNWLIERTGSMHGIYPIAYEPLNEQHQHYRISQLSPEKVETDACYNPMCSHRPRYWKGSKYAYWSVDSCSESVTRQMAERLMLGSEPDNC